MMVPAIPEIMVDPGLPRLKTSAQMATFVVSVYVLGFAIGPLFAAPISEMVGRTVVYGVSSCLHAAFTIACAMSPHLSALTAFRFFAGVFGSFPIALGGSSISDVMPADSPHIGKAMTLWTMSSLVGPVRTPLRGYIMLLTVCDRASRL